MEEPTVLLENKDGIRTVILTEARLHETLKLMREAFYTDEPPSKAVQLQDCPEAIDELENLTIETFRDGASVIALSKDDKVIGACFNKVQFAATAEGPGYFKEFRDKKCKTHAGKEYVDCMIRMDQKKDVFTHYNVDRSLELMFLATARDFRGQGVGRLLAQASVEVARIKRLPLVSIICTSLGSQRIGTSLGWDQLVTVPMSEHVFRGEPYSARTGEHQSQILMARRVNL